MLVPPLQNQDFVHRSETVADQRNAESAKGIGTAERLLDLRRQKDQEQAESVSQTGTPEADPDATRGEKRQTHSRKSSTAKGVPEPPESQKDPDLRNRTDGGQFLDMHV